MPMLMQIAASLADDREGDDTHTLSRRGKSGDCQSARGFRDARADNKASDTPTGTPRTPRLRLAPLTPLNCSSETATARAFLSSLDRIEIHGAEKDSDGVTYYAVDSYRFVCTSRIPTNRLRQQLEQHRHRHLRPRGVSSSSSSSSSEMSSVADPPTFRVRRRYSEFAALREATMRHICLNAMFICPQCHAVETYMRFGVAQPRLLMRVATGVKQRQRLLKKFLDELMALATSRRFEAHKDCRMHDQLPRLLELFLSSS